MRLPCLIKRACERFAINGISWLCRDEIVPERNSQLEVRDGLLSLIRSRWRSVPDWYELRLIQVEASDHRRGRSRKSS